MPALILLGIMAFLFVVFFLRIIPEYQRAVILRLGRVKSGRIHGPGLVVVIPFVDQVIRVDMRTVALDVPPQDIITRDNVSISVNAVVYFRVVEALGAIMEVENYAYATSQLSQTVLRTVLGEADLDELLSRQADINRKLQTIIDERTDPWGIKVSLVEIKHVDLPQEMKRSMAKQAEAERERRAKIIIADAEHQAARKLCMAASEMEQHPASLQLRYLQTLSEIAVENNSTIAFPVPLGLIEGLFGRPRADVDSRADATGPGIE